MMAAKPKCYSDPVNVELARISADFFEKFPHLRPVRGLAGVSEAETPTEVVKHRKK